MLEVPNASSGGFLLTTAGIRRGSEPVGQDSAIGVGAVSGVRPRPGEYTVLLVHHGARSAEATNVSDHTSNAHHVGSQGCKGLGPGAGT